MSDKFAVEIISPEKTILKTDASEVILPSYEGEIGILKNHIPLITFLRPGLIKIKGNMEIMFFAEDGTVEFVKNNLLRPFFRVFVQTQYIIIKSVPNILS